MLRFYKFIIFEIRTAAKRRGNSPLRRQIMGGKKLFFSTIGSLLRWIESATTRKDPEPPRYLASASVAILAFASWALSWCDSVGRSGACDDFLCLRGDTVPLGLPGSVIGLALSTQISDSAPRPCPRSVCEGRLLARLQGHAGGHGIGRETPVICPVGG